MFFSIDFNPYSHMPSKTPVLVVGLARSGTSLVSQILGSLPGVHIEAVSHVLWRSGNFKYLNDEEYDINEHIVRNIRNRFAEGVADKFLVEKSPINCLRPFLVHAVFPHAKIVYLEQDPVRCVYSGYLHSVTKDSFKTSSILKKYLLYTGSRDLSCAVSKRKIWHQLSAADIPVFFYYNAFMFYHRQFTNLLPFGPKMKNFTSIVRDKGLLYYHAELYKTGIAYKKIYKSLYGDRLCTFRMEDIITNENEIKRLIEFSGIPYDEGNICGIGKTPPILRAEAFVQPGSMEDEIRNLLQNIV